MHRTALILILLLAACDRAPVTSPQSKQTGAPAYPIPKDDRLAILEARISELETLLAAEKVTRERIDQQLANSIAEAERAALAQVPVPEAQNSSAR